MSKGSGRAVLPGSPYPLGATWDGRGVNFALFSAHAERVELCLFDPTGRHEEERIALPEYTDQVWHGYLPDAGPGLLYGYRVSGPYEPKLGHRFNHNKLLIDPYARALHGRIQWHPSLFGFRTDSSREDLTFDRRDNARYMAKCVVGASLFPSGADQRPRTPWSETIIYEAHVAGMTARHPEVPERLRGTYGGLASDAILKYLQDLGVTAIELLPVYPFLDEQHLAEKGRHNYWGYNPYAFFSPHPGYLGGAATDEFKKMVARFHQAGIEVILDVVYNHTAEGSHLGPTLSLKGIDNLSYYVTMPGDARHYLDHTGCGNTLNLAHPRVVQMVVDSLRYWVEEMHVDGFRFDLALALARLPTGYAPNAPFLTVVGQDPVLSQVKMIAEPWDLGLGGYQVGNFPPGWNEWNDRFRNAVRGFWRGDHNLIGEMATRLTGSSDLFNHDGRRPQASINFITAHDGFTLHDLVSYNGKHNEANGEGNRDGTDHNLSWNCGTEGPTRDSKISTLRDRQKRNMMATLLLSQGVPMLVAGDEFGRSQGGNNNAYCQDNEVSWLDWSLENGEDRAFLDFVKRLIELRRQFPEFHRTRFFSGQQMPGSMIKDVTWLSPDGEEMTDEDWSVPYARCFGFHVAGLTAEEDGTPRTPDRFIMLLNAHDGAVGFRLPRGLFGQKWTTLIDSARDAETAPLLRPAGAIYDLEPRSLVLLIADRRRDAEPTRRARADEKAPAKPPARRAPRMAAARPGRTPKSPGGGRKKMVRKRPWR